MVAPRRERVGVGFEDIAEPRGELMRLGGVGEMPRIRVCTKSWLPDPGRMLRWLRLRWFAVVESVIIALNAWTWFQPSLETTKTLGFGWVAGIWLRNRVVMIKWRACSEDKRSPPT